MFARFLSLATRSLFTVDWFPKRNERWKPAGSFQGAFAASRVGGANIGAGSMIVDVAEPVTLVGGAPSGNDDLAAARAVAPIVVAADGGADTCLAAGIAPVAVIGDMDSLSDTARVRFADRLFAVTEQETTDFDKALRHVAAPLVVAVGFSGGRFDHELAVLNSLLRHPGRPCVILGRESLTFLCPPQLDLRLAPATPVSLFPLGPAPVRSTGLVWPTDGLDFRPEGRIGTSNAMGPGGAARLVAATPRMLVILPRAALEPAAAALRAAPRWP